MNHAKYGQHVSRSLFLKKTLLLLPFFLAGHVFAQTTPLANAVPAQPAHYAATPTPPPKAHSLDDLALIARQLLVDKTKDINGRTEIIINPIDGRVRLSYCAKPVAYLSQGAKIWGRTTIGIRCESPDTWRTMVKAHVKIFSPYLVAAKPLPQGHVITAADLALVTGDITAIRGGVLTTKEQAVGRTVSRTIQASGAIWPEQLRAVKAIQQGQAVRIISKGPGFVVSSEGHALNTAAEGQVAKAKIGNGNIVRGIAKADGIIEVAF